MIFREPGDRRPERHAEHPRAAKIPLALMLTRHHAALAHLRAGNSEHIEKKIRGFAFKPLESEVYQEGMTKIYWRRAAERLADGHQAAYPPSQSIGVGNWRPDGNRSSNEYDAENWRLYPDDPDYGSIFLFEARCILPIKAHIETTDRTVLFCPSPAEVPETAN